MLLVSLLRLMRPGHYLKNGLILVPLVFSSELFNIDKLWMVLWAMVIFSLMSSVVYIINDIRDIKKDRLHPVKKNRPLASGSVQVWQAITLVIILTALSIAIGILVGISLMSWVFVLVYVLMNIGYSFGLKNMPIVDVSILAAGFIIRVFYGGEVVGVDVSSWLYLTILAGAFYMSLGKRRNEILMVGTSTRKVNKEYSIGFLDKNMYVFLSLVLVFYSLWVINVDRGSGQLFWTIPIVMLILMTYSFSIERDNSHGDPLDVFINNKALIGLIVLYSIMTIGILYL